MKRLIIALAVASLPAAAGAQTISCQTIGTMTTCSNGWSSQTFNTPGSSTTFISPPASIYTPPNYAPGSTPDFIPSIRLSK